MLTQDLSIFETKSQLTRLGPNSDEVTFCLKDF